MTSLLDFLDDLPSSDIKVHIQRTRFECALFCPYSPSTSLKANKAYYAKTRRQWSNPPTWRDLVKELSWPGRTPDSAITSILGYIKRESSLDWKILDGRTYSPLGVMQHLRIWNIQHPMKNHCTLMRKKRRIRFLLQISSELKCVSCGCNVYDLLEVNHKNGGGARESVEYRSRNSKLETEVSTGRRSVSDLEICCRVCNAVHYVDTLLGYRGCFKVTFESPP